MFQSVDDEKLKRFKRLAQEIAGAQWSSVLVGVTVAALLYEGKTPHDIGIEMQQCGRDILARSNPKMMT